MKRWSEKFLNSVCQPALMEEVENLTQTCVDFNAKLKRLKANVLSSELIDRDEFEDIEWDDMISRSTEHRFLRKIQQGLDTMASTPMGKDILSGLYASTYFGVAPMEQTGRFFDRSCPMVFLRASEDVFKNKNLMLKILVHESVHAKNVEIKELLCAYVLTPELSFMKHMFNELSAYLSEQVVIAQKQNRDITTAHQTQQQVFDLLEQLVDGGYVSDFSNRVIRCHRADILNPKKSVFSQQHLPLFAYYFKSYPVLCDLAVIDRLHQAYNHHVVKKARRQMQRKEAKHTR